MTSMIDLCFVLVVIIFFQLVLSSDDTCDRRPLGAKTAPLPPDDRFLIDISTEIEGFYIPQYNYTVRLYSRDNQSTFIAFTISLREDTKYNDKNPRKPLHLNAGFLRSLSSANSREGSCENSLMQADITPKTSVEVLWIAPGKENKCVTVYALLAVKPDVWYSFEGPLSKRVCEDTRKMDDMPPPENDNCKACEDARYQFTFEGMWSYNTHPFMFPTSQALARFSDVVGAAHSKNFVLYKYNAEASQGMKMLAEQGNTTQLELEILAQLDQNVRTIIKAHGQPNPNMTTTSMFRVSQEHHLVSLVCAILPSPDWFLGVSNLELCDVNTGQWAKNITLNLYPMDAGTDKGLTFEAANDDTSPPQPISLAVVRSSQQDVKVDKEEVKPFARIKLDLVRTYSNPECSTNEVEVTKLHVDGDGYYEPTTSAPVYVSEESPAPDPSSPENCLMTAWEDWFPCEGGMTMRLRYHLVDGVAVGKYIANAPETEDKEIPPECEVLATNEFKECEEETEDEVRSELLR